MSIFEDVRGMFRQLLAALIFFVLACLLLAGGLAALVLVFYVTQGHL
jgi:hypothetical protein